MEDLLEFGWKTHLVLVSGYFGYVIGFSGKRRDHKPSDQIAITLVFGLIALACITLLERSHPTTWPPVLAVGTILITTVSAILWRAKLHGVVLKVAKFFRVDLDDGFRSAWLTLINEPKLTYSQVLVTVRDGRCLESFGLAPYNDLPNGSCVLGMDGSIALYVNAITDKDGNRREIKSISDDNGHRITFIPAGEIVEVDLRRALQV